MAPVWLGSIAARSVPVQNCIPRARRNALRWTRERRSLCRGGVRSARRPQDGKESTDMAKKGRDLLRDSNFRQLVKECAVDHDVVAHFNAIHGLNLRCPIEPLVDPVFPLALSEEEVLHIAWFVAWLQHNQWRWFRAATTNLQEFTRLYSSERAASRPRQGTGKAH